jgi:hypothetical protein
MPELIVEIVGRGSGQSVFHKIAALPVRIGRALDNDIVLSDPYVSPSHLAIEAGCDGFVVADQNSDNGTFTGRGRRIEHAAEIPSGETIFIGRTALRLWSPDHQVGATLRFPARQSIGRRIAVPLLSFTVMIAATVFVTVEQFLGVSVETKPLAILAEALPVLFFPLLWAGVWALAGFMVRRRGDYGLQLIAANVAFMLFSLLTGLVQFVDFFTSSVRWADMVQYAGMGLLGVLLLLVNLRIATGALDLRRIVIVLAIGAGIITVVAVTDHVESSENRIVAEYSKTLKPPFARVSKSITLDQFFNEGEKLFKENPKLPSTSK